MRGIGEALAQTHHGFTASNLIFQAFGQIIVRPLMSVLLCMMLQRPSIGHYLDARGAKSSSDRTLCDSCMPYLRHLGAAQNSACVDTLSTELCVMPELEVLMLSKDALQHLKFLR